MQNSVWSNLIFLMIKRNIINSQILVKHFFVLISWGWLSETFMTNFTLVWSFSCMYPIMNCQLLISTEHFSTSCALKCFHACMHLFMGVQVWWLAKIFITNIAMKGFFPSMKSFVSSQMCRLCECTWTRVTLIRLFSSMLPDMDFQSIWMQEYIVTFITFE